MQPHQARILARIADEIDSYRAGEATAVTLQNRIWGLVTAAEVERSPEGEQVTDLYNAASNAFDAQQSWMPPEHRTSATDFEAALEELRTWATSLAIERDASG